MGFSTSPSRDGQFNGSQQDLFGEVLSWSSQPRRTLFIHMSKSISNGNPVLEVIFCQKGYRLGGGAGQM